MSGDSSISKHIASINANLNALERVHSAKKGSLVRVSPGGDPHMQTAIRDYGKVKAWYMRNFQSEKYQSVGQRRDALIEDLKGHIQELSKAVSDQPIVRNDRLDQLAALSRKINEVAQEGKTNNSVRGRHRGVAQLMTSGFRKDVADLSVQIAVASERSGYSNERIEKLTQSLREAWVNTKNKHTISGMRSYTKQLNRELKRIDTHPNYSEELKAELRNVVAGGFERVANQTAINVGRISSLSIPAKKKAEIAQEYRSLTLVDILPNAQKLSANNKELNTGLNWLLTRLSLREPAK